MPAQIEESEPAVVLDKELPPVTTEAFRLAQQQAIEEEAPVPEVEKKKTTPEQMAKAGTPDQDVVIDDYPTHEVPDKLRIPYIERYNGNVCVKNGNYVQAIGHYNKALLSMKMLF